ncbi:A-kinase-interacting protein 1 isoform X2 [Dromaius novaehollandiae]|uniref:A-kinase-interacting protein 1 isoform X2 n=1 Tax=Dromaius novaehollandiae TaxID=8790 RepID=UPI00311F87C9
MERARTAGLARAVLERARGAAAAAEADPERLGAAFAAAAEFMGHAAGQCQQSRKDPVCLVSVTSSSGLGSASPFYICGSKLVSRRGEARREKYYSLVPACRCKEHEIKHICRYHSKQAGEKVLEAAEKKNAASVVCSQPRTCQQRTRKASKDIYIEVSPGTYSITATSEDMVKQTHVK